MTDREFPHSLARKWFVDYGDFLFTTIALRELLRRPVSRGPIRALLTARAVVLLETTDQLAAFGYRPSLRLAGAESDLWTQTVRYASRIPWLVPPAGVAMEILAADLAAMQTAWEQFEAFVRELPNDFFESSVVLAAASASTDQGIPSQLGPQVRPTAIVLPVTA